MNSTVLAFSGGLASSASVSWLTERTGAGIVTITLDVGQGEELSALRARALACGAFRAHAIDAREDLARELLFPSLTDSPFGEGQYPVIAPFVIPLVARALVDMARIEGTRRVAHGAPDRALDEAIHALDGSIEVLAPAREWSMNRDALAEYARRHGVAAWVQHGAGRIEQTLWGRCVIGNHGEEPGESAPRPPTQEQLVHLEITFERGVPVAVNGVTMSPVELIESVALIAGRSGVGRLATDGGGYRVVYDAPAAVTLRAARAASVDGGGVVRLSFLNGQYTVMKARDPQLVNHA